MQVFACMSNLGSSSFSVLISMKFLFPIAIVHTNSFYHIWDETDSVQSPCRNFSLFSFLITSPFNIHFSIFFAFCFGCRSFHFFLHTVHRNGYVVCEQAHEPESNETKYLKISSMKDTSSGSCPKSIQRYWLLLLVS